MFLTIEIVLANILTGVVLATDDTITEDLHADENASLLLKLDHIKMCVSGNRSENFR